MRLLMCFSICACVLTNFERFWGAGGGGALFHRFAVKFYRNTRACILTSPYSILHVALQKQRPVKQDKDIVIKRRKVLALLPKKCGK
jgi:hypothetical protein